MAGLKFRFMVTAYGPPIDAIARTPNMNFSLSVVSAQLPMPLLLNEGE